MKLFYLILSLFLVIVSCSTDDFDYAIVEGKVQRAINGDGIPGQSVTVMTRESSGSGMFSSITTLDSKKVVTDVNGNFSVSLLSNEDAFASFVYTGNEDYHGADNYRGYPIDEPLIIEVNKLIKFKIFVKNINPFDEGSY